MPAAVWAPDRGRDKYVLGPRPIGSDLCTEKWFLAEECTRSLGDGERGGIAEFPLDGDRCPVQGTPVCLPTFDIKVYIDDASGAHLFSKKLTIQQKC